jgi:HTH-type transcriptional regulator, sugar sensing transcriptional regulator
MIENILENLGFSNNSIRVYSRLLEVGPSSAGYLAAVLGLPRPTVYDHLKLLMNQGLVIDKEQDNKRLFLVDDFKNIEKMIKERQEKLKESEKILRHNLPQLDKQIKFFEPKIKFYTGPSGIRQVLNNLFWYENIETLTMWPIKEMIEIVGREYLESLNRKRIRQNISIRGIWPQDQLVDLEHNQFLGVGPKHLRTMRLSPKKITWSMSYWLFADKCAFISSKREGFSFLVSSQDFVDLIRVQFEALWSISKALKFPQYKDTFITTV